MADGPKNTDGTGTTDTSTATPAAQPAPQPGSDTRVDTGLLSRVDGLTAERGRLRDDNAALKQQIEAMKAQQMSEQEKLVASARAEAVEVWKKEHHEPLATIAAQHEAYFARRLEEMKKAVPEERQPKAIEHLPAFEQAQVYESIIASSGGPKSNSLGTTVNPQGDAKRDKVPYSEFVAWQQSASTDLKAYEEQKKEMWTARQENRIDYEK